MKPYGRIDLHSNNSVIAMVDQDGNTLINKQLANDIKCTLLTQRPFNSIEG